MIDRLRVSAYRALSSPLLRSWRTRLSGSRLSGAVRRLLLQRDGQELAQAGPVQFEGFEFRFRAPIPILHRAQTQGIENIICRLALAHCAPGGCAVDVGANWGFVTLVMAHAVGDTGTVLSAEAVPGIHAGLAHNVRLNGFEDRCSALNVALGASSEQSPRALPAAAMDVSRSTLDELVREHGAERVHMVKIDVDGADLEVLQGASQTLEAHRPLLVVELSRDVEEIFALVRQLGYRHLLDMQGRPAKVSEPPPNLIASVDPLELRAHT